MTAEECYLHWGCWEGLSEDATGAGPKGRTGVSPTRSGEAQGRRKARQGQSLGGGNEPECLRSRRKWQLCNYHNPPYDGFYIPTPISSFQEEIWKYPSE